MPGLRFRAADSTKSMDITSVPVPLTDGAANWKAILWAKIDSSIAANEILLQFRNTANANNAVQVQYTHATARFGLTVRDSLNVSSTANVTPTAAGGFGGKIVLVVVLWEAASSTFTMWGHVEGETANPGPSSVDIGVLAHAAINRIRLGNASSTIGPGAQAGGDGYVATLAVKTGTIATADVDDLWSRRRLMDPLFRVSGNLNGTTDLLWATCHCAGSVFTVGTGDDAPCLPGEPLLPVTTVGTTTNLCVYDAVRDATSLYTVYGVETVISANAADTDITLPITAPGMAVWVDPWVEDPDFWQLASPAEATTEPQYGAAAVFSTIPVAHASPGLAPVANNTCTAPTLIMWHGNSRFMRDDPMTALISTNYYAEHGADGIFSLLDLGQHLVPTPVVGAGQTILKSSGKNSGMMRPTAGQRTTGTVDAIETGTSNFRTFKRLTSGSGNGGAIGNESPGRLSRLSNSATFNYAWNRTGGDFDAANAFTIMLGALEFPGSEVFTAQPSYTDAYGSATITLIGAAQSTTAGATRGTGTLAAAGISPTSIVVTVSSGTAPRVGEVVTVEDSTVAYRAAIAQITAVSGSGPYTLTLSHALASNAADNGAGNEWTTGGTVVRWGRFKIQRLLFSVAAGEVTASNLPSLYITTTISPNGLCMPALIVAYNNTGGAVTIPSGWSGNGYGNQYSNAFTLADPDTGLSPLQEYFEGYAPDVVMLAGAQNQSDAPSNLNTWRQLIEAIPSAPEVVYAYEIAHGAGESTFADDAVGDDWTDYIADNAALHGVVGLSAYAESTIPRTMADIMASPGFGNGPPHMSAGANRYMAKAVFKQAASVANGGGGAAMVASTGAAALMFMEEEDEEERWIR